MRTPASFFWLFYVTESSADYIISQCVTNYNATAEDVDTNWIYLLFPTLKNPMKKVIIYGPFPYKSTFQVKIYGIFHCYVSNVGEHKRF